MIGERYEYSDIAVRPTINNKKDLVRNIGNSLVQHMEALEKERGNLCFYEGS